MEGSTGEKIGAHSPAMFFRRAATGEKAAMRLRWAILGLIVVTFLGLVVVFTVSLQSILVPHFRTEEQRSAEVNIQRVLSALDNVYENLRLTANDWSRWDDSYNFLEGRQPDFAEDNLGDGSFTGLNVNLLAFVDSQGRLAGGRAYNLSVQQEEPLPAELIARFTPGDPLLGPIQSGTTARGIISTTSGPLMLVSAPVLRTDASGPPAGVFLIGRYLDQGELQRIEAVVSFPLSLYAIQDPALPPDFLAMRNILLGGQKSAFQPISENELGGYFLLTDFSGTPAYILRVDQARSIFRSSQIVLRYLYLSLAVGTLLFGLMTFLAVDRLVLARLTNLGREVKEIGRSGELEQRVTVSGQDELTTLSGNINQMLEDLHQSQRRRRESEERFRLVVESMDDMVFIIQPDLTSIRVYGEKARLLGIPERITTDGLNHLPELDPAGLARLGLEFTSDLENIEKHLAALQAALNGKHLDYEWEAQMSGETYQFQSVLSPMLDETGALLGVVGVGRDISGLKRLEAALRERVQELGALNEVSSVFLEQLDSSALLEESCRLLVERFGLAAAWIGAVENEEQILRPLAARGFECPPLPDLRMVDEMDDQTHPALRALAAREPVTVASLQDQPLSMGWVEAECGFGSLLALPVELENQQLVGVLFSQQVNSFTPARVQLYQALMNLTSVALRNTNLFQQVRSDQERLQSLSHRLVEVQEEERRQIALELHDEVGQLLTGLKLQLDLGATSGDNGIGREALQRGRSLVEELIRKVRNLSLDLRPSMLDDLGLLPALFWHFDRYTSLTGIRINFYHGNLEGQRYSTDLETTAYRVIQEALTNVARYAGVKEAEVRVIHADGYLTIQVEDRGQGFDPVTTLAAGRSRGLAGIQERVTLVNGSLTIDSVPGWGTSLTVELPVDMPLQSEDRAELPRKRE